MRCLGPFPPLSAAVSQGRCRRQVLLFLSTQLDIALCAAPPPALAGRCCRFRALTEVRRSPQAVTKQKGA